jgi:hypothetical protein
MNMSKENHLICPPTWLVPEDLLDQWEEEWHRAKIKHLQLSLYIAAQAAQWGADQELEACCEWLDWPGNMHLLPSDLRAARRPKPPSLKEQALAELAEWENVMDIAPDSPIRRALEQLPND